MLYTWDHRNRLTKVTIRDSNYNITKQVDYVYDAFNQLVKRTVDPDGDFGSSAIDQAFYLYDQGQVALEFQKTGAGIQPLGTSSRWGHPAVGDIQPLGSRWGHPTRAPIPAPTLQTRPMARPGWPILGTLHLSCTFGKNVDN
jgi:hypothetical protein